MKKRSCRGFTTIEFVIAVLFVGVLAVIAISVFNEARMQERDEQRVADIELLQNALSLYFDTFGGYPSSYTELSERGFLNDVPRDPRTGGFQFYTPLNIGCTSYHLGALLEAKEEATLIRDSDALIGTVGVGCPDGGSGTEDFSGIDPLYDIRP